MVEAGPWRGGKCTAITFRIVGYSITISPPMKSPSLKLGVNVLRVLYPYPSRNANRTAGGAQRSGAQTVTPFTPRVIPQSKL